MEHIKQKEKTNEDYKLIKVEGKNVKVMEA